MKAVAAQKVHHPLHPVRNQPLLPLLEGARSVIRTYFNSSDDEDADEDKNRGKIKFKPTKAFTLSEFWTIRAGFSQQSNWYLL